MDQKSEDIYEFKSSKDGAPNSPSEVDSKKDSENISTNAPQPTSPKRDENEKEATKRGASELDLNEDEESKRKRRKEEKADVKGPGRSTGRTGPVDKVVKATAAKGAASAKTSASNSILAGDRKSPSNSAGNSPKASSKGDSESDGDEGKRDPGPKVPPLKIVIPQQSSSEQEQGTRNGKNGNGRHQALPYVVTSSSNDSEGAVSDKVEVVPIGATVIKDEKKDAAALQVSYSNVTYVLSWI